MSEFDNYNLNTEYEQKELDMLPQTGTTTADAAVEVCPLCDIAGCRHIRERNASAATPPVQGEGEPVSWQRLATGRTEWQHVPADEILHQKAMGYQVRPLYAHPDAQEIARLRKHADRGWALFKHWNTRYLDCATERDRLCCARDDDGIQIMQLNASIERAEAECDMWKGASKRWKEAALLSEARIAEVEAECDDLAKSLHAEVGARDDALVRAEKAEAERDAIGAATFRTVQDALWEEAKYIKVDEVFAEDFARVLDVASELIPDASKATLDKLIADAVRADRGEMVARCASCDGTGDVHRADGEWLGECPCTHPAPASAGVTVKPLVDALGFYADASAWNQPPVRTKEGLVSIEYENQASRMQRDRGRIAREALATAQSVSEGGE